MSLDRSSFLFNTRFPLFFGHCINYFVEGIYMAHCLQQQRPGCDFTRSDSDNKSSTTYSFCSLKEDLFCSQRGSWASFDVFEETMTMTMTFQRGHTCLSKSQYELSRYRQSWETATFFSGKLLWNFSHRDLIHSTFKKRVHEMTMITLQHKKKIMMSCEEKRVQKRRSDERIRWWWRWWWWPWWERRPGNRQHDEEEDQIKVMFAGGEEEDLQMNSAGETKGSPFELESESFKWNLWELNKACILLMTTQLSFLSRPFSMMDVNLFPCFIFSLPWFTAFTVMLIMFTPMLKLMLNASDSHSNQVSYSRTLLQKRRSVRYIYTFGWNESSCMTE